MEAVVMVVLGGLGLVVVALVVLWIIFSRWRKVGPNEALIISGRTYSYLDAKGQKHARGFRIKKGGGTWIMPFIERAEVLSLELMTLDVKTPEVYTAQGVPVMVDGVAQIKVRGDDVAIATSAEQFLGKSTKEISEIGHQTIEGHLRAILGTLSVEDLYKNREVFSQKVQEVAAGDMANMGLQIVSFTLKDIKDNQGYLDALGKPRAAQIKRDAQIAEAEMQRDADIKKAEAARDAAIAQANAKQQGDTVRFQAQTKIAESERDFQMKTAEYQAQVNLKKADADLAYDLQKNIRAQDVKREEVKVIEIERNAQIAVQEKEVARREKELDAQVKKPAEAQRYQVEQEADAKKYQIEAEARGQGEARKAQGFADAEVVQRTGEAKAASEKAQGLAQADIIAAKGAAEAEAMQKKAASWRQYGEAAVVQMVVEALPGLARAISEPLSKTEKIIVINSGGESAGASKITADVTNVMAQLPPILESLTGVDFKKMVEKLPGMKSQDQK